jgi:hypothetical protein
MRGGARQRERAASVFAILGNAEDIRKLASDPSSDVRHAVGQYIGANRDLLQFTVRGTPRTYDDFDSIVSTAQKKRRDLERELNSVPARLRAWRIRQILTWRGNSFDTSFRQVLQPGRKLWLAAQSQWTSPEIICSPVILEEIAMPERATATDAVRDRVEIHLLNEGQRAYGGLHSVHLRRTHGPDRRIAPRR